MTDLGKVSKVTQSKIQEPVEFLPPNERDAG